MMRGRDYGYRPMYDSRRYEDYRRYPKDYRAYPDTRYEDYGAYPDARYEDYSRYADDYRRYPDYARSEDDYALSDEELTRWGKKLLESISEKDKQVLKMENIIKKAEQLGIRFDMFTPYEYYLVVLMMFTDYSKTLGVGNYDIYMKMAKDWLCDEDVAVKYGKKLSSYYENIVNDRF